jgi:Polyphosphate kinase 2 (PPK2)
MPVRSSTDWAPWHVVPADRNWVKSLAVAELLLDALERIDPKLPEPPPASRASRSSDGQSRMNVTLRWTWK